MADDEVDIRGRVRTALLTIIDALGQPARAAGSLHLRGETSDADTWLRFDDGSLRVPIGGRPVSGTLCVAGYRDLELREEPIDGERVRVVIEHAVIECLQLDPNFMFHV